MVKKGVLFGAILLASLFFIQAVSAEIIFTKQPSDVYNLGQRVEFPMTIKTLNEISEILDVYLLCEGHEVNFYKNGVFLSSGQEQKVTPSLILSTNILGDVKGSCKVKAQLGEDYIISDQFKISSVISLTSNAASQNYTPGTSVIIKGDAIKEDKSDVNGFIELTLKKGNSSEVVKSTESISNGFYTFNITLDKDIAAGDYLVALTAYEKNNKGEKTNTGLASYGIKVAQIPKSLEIFLENKEAIPGEDLEIQTILHDQTGERMNGGESLLKITKENGMVLEQVTVKNNEVFTFPVAKNQAPESWTIEAISDEGLENLIEIQIAEVAAVDIQIINKTILIENVGNVMYCNKTTLVTIGNQTMNIDPCLDVGENEEYKLKAPDGTYNVLVKTNEGETFSANNVTLSGNAVSVDKGGKASFARYPIVWIFIIAILAYISFLLYSKRHNKSFFAYFTDRKKKKGDHDEGNHHHVSLMHHPTGSDEEKPEIKQKALLSLSIKGEKQDVAFINLKLKNQKDLFQKEDNTKNTIQKIIHLAEEARGYVYESHDNLTFIFAPAKTRTFKNEKKVTEIAQDMEKILNGHNKIYKKEIDYGLSINFGPMIIKPEKHILHFTSIGTLLNEAKKLAILANKTLFISEHMNARILTDAKTEKHTKDGKVYYLLKEVKNNAKNSRFINDFIHRLEKD